jgi:uncharacterized protein (DUF1800 family)
MLFYLDNYLNGRPQGGSPVINENYAREVLELHSIGTEDPITGAPNYTQDDVVAASKILSGWRIRAPGLLDPITTAFGEFYFDPLYHVTGPKIVLGHVFQDLQSPEIEGKELLAFLSDPAFPPPNVAHKTARFLAYKLLRWFLTPSPSASQVSQVEGVYMANGGKIEPMLEEIFSSANVQAANNGQHLKFKTPYELVCSLFRATEAELSNSTPNIITELQILGNMPFGWGPPDGYPTTAEAWGRNLLTRWSFCHRFFERRYPPTGGEEPGIPGIDLTAAKLAQMLGFPSLDAVPRNDIATHIEAMLTGPGTMDPNDLTIVQEFADKLASDCPAINNELLIREACGVAASSPSFQYF